MPGASGPGPAAVGPRLDGSGNLIIGVNEYILYVTDGWLAVLALLLASGLVFLTIVLTQRASR
jgi:hypothetical protein